jgi:hypothetical protein
MTYLTCTCFTSEHLYIYIYSSSCKYLIESHKLSKTTCSLTPLHRNHMLQPLDILKFTQICIQVSNNAQVTDHKQDGCQMVSGPQRQRGDVKLPSFLNGNAPRGEKERRGTHTKSVHIKDHVPLLHRPQTRKSRDLAVGTAHRLVLYSTILNIQKCPLSSSLL